MNFETLKSFLKEKRLDSKKGSGSVISSEFQSVSANVDNCPQVLLINKFYFFQLQVGQMFFFNLPFSL